ncbi:MAG: sugar phosphate nucleotidyltransferase, partial [Candidatus Saganbacteria bacterium]|nr:sugar phosphate nucleotidyltransferase [Candidatus Saganbacteria bacterium]
MDVTCIILAAGKGVRMRSEGPKVFHEILGKPMLSYVLQAAFDLDIKNIFVVIGHQSEVIRNFYWRLPITFVLQSEQLGTAHAVMQVEPVLSNFSSPVLVLNGDMPLIRSGTLARLIDEHASKGSAATILTAIMDNPGSFGRIVRDKAGEIIRIVEQKDANEEELEIKEINTGTYVFEKDALFSALHEVKPLNVQNEYYLTDCIELMRKKGRKISSASVQDPLEA